MLADEQRAAAYARTISRAVAAAKASDGEAHVLDAGKMPTMVHCCMLGGTAHG